MAFATIDPTRIAELTRLEEERLDANTQASKHMLERAEKHLAGGVASSYQLRDPWPIYIERGDVFDRYDRWYFWECRGILGRDLIE